MRRQPEASVFYTRYKQNNSTIVKMRINNYTVLQQIGEGRYGRVFKALDHNSENLVAIKLLDIRDVEGDFKEEKKILFRRYIDQEDKKMRKFHHPNILPCLDVISNSDLKMIVSPFCKEGTLEEQLMKYGPFQEQLAINILKQLVNGIAEMHSKKVIHRDLKLENIFRLNGRYLIGDFGHSKVIDQLPGKHTKCGSIYTRAPEVEKGYYGLKADIWSLGAIFYLMLACKGNTEQTCKLMIKQAKQKKISITLRNGKSLSLQSKKFLRQTLVFDPEQRVGWRELKNHDLLTKQKSKDISAYYVIPSEELDLSVVDSAIEIDLEQDKTNSFIEGSEIIKEKPVQPIISIQTTRSNVFVEDESHYIISHKIEQMEVVTISPNISQKIQTSQELIVYEILKNFHLNALIAECVLQKYIVPIEKYQLLPLQEKKSIQLMYLLSGRCFLNMSPIFDGTSIRENSIIYGSEIRNFTRQGVKDLYKICKQKFDHYSSQLTKLENKFSSIVKDLWGKSEKKRNYQKFFTGIQKKDYTKEEQVQFTQGYLKKISTLQCKDEGLQSIIINRFQAYERLNQLTPNDLENRSFQTLVRNLMS